MADPQGRLHALRRPGLPVPRPAPGAIVQYSRMARGLRSSSTASVAVTVSPAVRSMSRRLSKKDNQASKASRRSAPPCRGRTGTGVRQDRPTQAIARHQGRHHQRKPRGASPTPSRAVTRTPACTTQGVGGTHVMYALQHADKPEAYNALPGSGYQSDGECLEGHYPADSVRRAGLGRVRGPGPLFRLLGPKAKHEEE